MNIKISYNNYLVSRSKREINSEDSNKNWVHKSIKNMEDGTLLKQLVVGFWMSYS